jgi:hypothetical protein
VTAQSGRPPDRARTQRGPSPIGDIGSDWRRWSVAERVGAVAIGAAWLGAVPLLMLVNAG